MSKVRLLTFAAVLMLILSCVSSFASVPVPVPDIDVSVSVSVNSPTDTISWDITNLTESDFSGYRLIRVDWLYPIYPVSPSGPAWYFAEHQLAPDDWNMTFAFDAVSWITNYATGLEYGDSEIFSIISGIPVSEQLDLYPLHLVWQRPPDYGNPYTIDTGVVPEPASILMLLFGAGGIGSLVWRRKSA